MSVAIAEERANNLNKDEAHAARNALMKIDSIRRGVCGLISGQLNLNRKPQADFR